MRADPAPPLGSPTLLTYRYLRLGVVGLTVLLGVSVGLQVADDGAVLGSVSAYYYTPVRSIFVGTLVASGLALIVIQGRARRAEDVLLNLAGLLTPVIAVVPTPIPACSDRRSCVPASYVDGVDNNVQALLAVAVLSLLVIGWGLRRRALGDPPTRWGLGGAVVIIGGLGGLYLLDRAAFLTTAHYLAAVPFFLLMVAVAGLNAIESSRRMGTARVSVSYRSAYAAVAVAMLVTVTGAGLMAVVLVLTDPGGTGALGGPGPWLLVVEVVLLALFTAFWALQTQEFWTEVRA